MSARFVYLDSSAFAKLVMAEPESTSLRQFLRRRPKQASAALLRTEAMRAARRVDGRLVPAIRSALARLLLVRLTPDLLDRAGTLDPPEIRSLDAIHLAAALSLGDDLGQFVTYDETMAEAARSLNFKVASPR